MVFNRIASPNIRNSKILKIYDEDENGYQKIENSMNKEVEVTDLPYFKQLYLDMTFYFVFAINMAVNLDHGAIPACTYDIQIDLNLNNK